MNSKINYVVNKYLKSELEKQLLQLVYFTGLYRLTRESKKRKRLAKLIDKRIRTFEEDFKCIEEVGDKDTTLGITKLIGVVIPDYGNINRMLKLCLEIEKIIVTMKFYDHI